MNAQATLNVYDSLTIVTTSLPSGVTGTSYGQSLTAVGGNSSFTWTITAGSLPPGVSLDSSTGVLSGAPTAIGSFSFTVEAMTGEGQTASMQLTVDVFAPLAVTTPPLPPVLIGTGYSQFLTSTGGDGAIAWAVSVGSPPLGLSLDGVTGEISGTPTASGVTVFSVAVTSSDGQSASQEVSIEVYAVLAVTTPSLTSGATSTAYSQAVEAAGGDGTYGWTITSGSLPSGLTLNGADGTISGTTGAAESQTFTIEVTSGDGQVASRDLTLVVANLLGRWVDVGGSPIESANVGAQVRLQICFTDPDVAAFQSDVQSFGAYATISTQGDLDSSGAGVHAHCSGTVDVLDDGFTSSGTADPVTALIVSNAASPGTGPVGIFQFVFDLTAAGVLEIDLPSSSIFASDFSGNPLTIFQGIHALTVN